MDSNSLPTERDEVIALAKRLREARKYVDLLQEDVAIALNMSRSTISDIEAGKRSVTAFELRRFARLYRRTVSWLLGEEQVDEDHPVYQTTADLSDKDKEQVLRFAEFLAGAGPPGKSTYRGTATG